MFTNIMSNTNFIATYQPSIDLSGCTVHYKSALTHGWEMTASGGIDTLAVPLTLRGTRGEDGVSQGSNIVKGNEVEIIVKDKTGAIVSPENYTVSIPSDIGSVNGSIVTFNTLFSVDAHSNMNLTIKDPVKTSITIKNKATNVNLVPPIATNVHYFAFEIYLTITHHEDAITGSGRECVGGWMSPLHIQNSKYKGYLKFYFPTKEDFDRFKQDCLIAFSSDHQTYTTFEEADYDNGRILYQYLFNVTTQPDYTGTVNVRVDVRLDRIGQNSSCGIKYYT